MGLHHPASLRTPIVALLVLSLCVGLSGCGGDGEEDGLDLPAPASAVAVVATTGGEVATSNGTSVLVPAGAVPSGIKIAVAEMTQGAVKAHKPEGLQYQGHIVAVTPHGASFAQPVTLKVPYTGSATALLRADHESDLTWEVLEGVQFDDAAGIATVQVKGFSVFVPVSGTEKAMQVIAEGLRCEEGSAAKNPDFGKDTGDPPPAEPADDCKPLGAACEVETECCSGGCGDGTCDKSGWQFQPCEINYQFSGCKRVSGVTVMESACAVSEPVTWYKDGIGCPKSVAEAAAACDITLTGVIEAPASCAEARAGTVDCTYVCGLIAMCESDNSGCVGACEKDLAECHGALEDFVTCGKSKKIDLICDADGDLDTADGVCEAELKCVGACFEARGF